MNHYLYILHSKSIDRYYVGESYDPQRRLERHIAHHFKKGFTKAADDWKLILAKKCGTKEDAIYLERFIKRMKSKKFIRKVIDRPEILDDILIKR